MRKNYSVFARSVISLIAIILPIILLAKGIYGSFLFTFSIPLIWQVGFHGKKISSLGIKGNSITTSIIVGVITGCLLGLIGGAVLKLSNTVGYSFTEADELRFSLGNFNLEFPLQKEAGYRLLSMRNAFLSTSFFLTFCIFAIGVGEELFWRGFLQKKIAGYLPINLSIFITATLFAMIHFYIFTILPVKAGIFFLLLIAFAGIAWGYLVKYFDNIWAAAISHGIVAFIIWKYYFFV
jgi:membrane protease YdiL (CAAX protease family)